MKKFFLIIIAFMVITVPMMAKESDNPPIPVPIILDTHPNDDDPNPTIPRAPMRICVEAWYDADLGSISINYYGEISGEVNLYCDGMLVATAPEINATFMICESGFYTIEILAESWTATGSIEI